MKLGILTVYLVNPADEPLLDLHLAQIRECTTVPYTIHAAVNRLADPLVEKLRRRADVRVCPCPTTGLRRSEEHSFYLEHLVRAAVEDGATHLVTLHPDSFPIRRDWSQNLAGRLSPSCALVTVNRIGTACLLFSRDFYLRYAPRFLLTDADRASPGFKAFRERWDPIDHSGAGYAFRAFSAGLSLSCLRESNRDARATFGIVYEGLLFHLVGVAGIGRSGEGRGGAPGGRRWARLWLARLWRLHAALGPSARRLLRAAVPASARHAVSRDVHSKAAAGFLFQEARRELLRDPKAYWESR